MIRQGGKTLRRLPIHWQDQPGATFRGSQRVEIRRPEQCLLVTDATIVPNSDRFVQFDVPII